jgi:hypothetical protein
MERLDKKLPDFRHGFERPAAQRIGVHGHPAPSNDTQPLGICSDFDGRPCFLDHRGRQKGKPDRKHLNQLNSLLLGSGAEKRLGERSQQPCAIAAGSVRVNSAAVREPLQSSQRKLDDVIARRGTEAGNEACTACVVVWVTPVGVTLPQRPGPRILVTALASTVPVVHTSLLNGWGLDVQRRILIL